MYKVMLVDDEIYMLNGLRHIINWEAYGFEIVGTASNGLKALELSKTLDIDIILTDVKMPKMNGLELIHVLKETKPHIKFIILSGYNDFDYVKEALQLGIENYLLKPINEEELLQTLINIVQKIEVAHTAYIKTLEDSSILKNNILNRWITHTISMSELCERAQLLDLDLTASHYIISVMQLLENKTIATDVNDLRTQIITLCHTYLSTLNLNLHHEVFCDFNGYILCYFSSTNTITDSNLNYDLIKDFMKHCILEINTQLNLNVICSIGSLETDFHNLAISYQNAIKLMKNFPSLPPNSLIDYETVSNSNFNTLIKRILDFINNHLSEDLSLKVLAAHFNVNPSYLGQLFKSETGQSFNNYLHQTRIEQAIKLLCNTSLNANEIALKVGYTNTNYFYTCFKKFTGKYPTNYRRSLTSFK